MNWIKDNWFKLIISIGVLGAVILAIYYTIYLPKQNTNDLLLKNLEEKHQLDLAEKEEKIAKLETQINEQQSATNTEKASSPTPISAPSKAEIDPTVKIEKCKAQAKKIADEDAKREYLLAFEKAQAAGDTETAQFYLEASFKPNHPANYDSNYQAEYIKCLDK